MYITAIVSTLIAWFAGLFIDANIGFEPLGILCFRMLFPVIAMGVCIIRAIDKSK